MMCMAGVGGVIGLRSENGPDRLVSSLYSK